MDNSQLHPDQASLTLHKLDSSNLHTGVEIPVTNTDFNFNVENFKIYYNEEPIIGENVLVKFTERNESHIEGEIIEYNYKGVMSYNDATKKKKVYSWNKIIPLNKLMVAKIEEVYDNNSAQISIAYNTNILKPFNDNKILYSSINKICYIYKIDFINFWESIIHKIDKKRKDELTNDSLLDTFVNNINLVYELINEKYNNPQINEKINELLIDKNVIYQIKFGLISNESINKTKLVIKNASNNNELNIKYDSAPYYILESNNIEEQQSFIALLEKECKEHNVFYKLFSSKTHGSF